MSDDVAEKLRELADDLEAEDVQDADDRSLVERAYEESGLYGTNDYEESEYPNAVDVSHRGKADMTSGELTELRDSDWYLVTVNDECVTIRPEEDEP